MRITLLVLTVLFFNCKEKFQHEELPKSQLNQNVNLELVDSLAKQLLKIGNLPGISIAVAKRDTVIYAKAFGYADVENGVKMTPNTRLRTASVAKVITATALGRLATENKIDFNTPIENYINYVNPPFDQLTIRQLAGHTSGVPHRQPRAKIENKFYNNIKETIDHFNDSQLLFKPDTAYRYSTGGYNFLSGVIEGASQKSFSDYMSEHIFEPLAMENTIIENINELSEEDAKLYYFDRTTGERKLDKELVDGSYKIAGAGFRSTPRDLVKMMMSYHNGFISERVVKEMFESSELINGDRTRVGIGWRMTYDAFGNQLVDHAGNWQGARTVVVYYPDNELSVSIMVNAQCQLFIEETAHIIAQLFMKQHERPKTFNPYKKSIAVKGFRSNGTVEDYKGTIQLNDDGSGKLIIDTERAFLQTIPIKYLGFGNHFAAVNLYGLLYLKLDDDSGQLYMYQNRNRKNPTEELPLISFTITN